MQFRLQEISANTAVASEELRLLSVEHSNQLADLEKLRFAKEQLQDKVTAIRADVEALQSITSDLAQARHARKVKLEAMERYTARLLDTECLVSKGIKGSHDSLAAMPVVAWQEFSCAQRTVTSSSMSLERCELEQKQRQRDLASLLSQTNGASGRAILGLSDLARPSSSSSGSRKPLAFTARTPRNELRDTGHLVLGR